MAANYDNVYFFVETLLGVRIKICGRVCAVDSTRHRHPVFFCFLFLLVFAPRLRTVGVWRRLGNCRLVCARDSRVSPSSASYRPLLALPWWAWSDSSISGLSGCLQSCVCLNVSIFIVLTIFQKTSGALHYKIEFNSTKSCD